MHVQIELCGVRDCQDLLCPFNHNNVSNNKETKSEAFEDEDVEEDEEVNENQCYLCRTQLQTKDDLYDHVQGNH